MSAPSLLLLRSSDETEQVSPDEGLSLLLDLFATEPAVPAPAAAPVPVASPRVALIERVQGWVQQAAAWGAGPQGAWRAW